MQALMFMALALALSITPAEANRVKAVSAVASWLYGTGSSAKAAAAGERAAAKTVALKKSGAVAATKESGEGKLKTAADGIELGSKVYDLVSPKCDEKKSKCKKR